MSRYETLIRETNPGIYIHVPFCAAKCPYCNFYSVKAEESLMDAYTEQICRALAASAERWQRRADTLYFGGGTPILLGARRIERIVSTARRHFGLQNAEITLEANPASTLEETLRDLFAAGVNRLSFGMQSADEEELRILGRRHTAKEAALMKAAISRNALALPVSAKDVLRAAVLRNMLIQVFRNSEEEERK